MFNENGVILYEGPSTLDGAPIVAIATGLTNKCQNSKTGDMIQIWIMHAAMPPTEAWKTDADKAVCGDCPLRKTENGKRICYVTLYQAPLSVWKAYKNGQYMTINRYPDAVQRITSKPIRVGAYGDPVAVPARYLIPLLCLAGRGWTGYTHQWRKDIAKPWKAYLQASCETANDAKLAQQQGWKYYRVISENDKPLKDEHMCPSNNGAHCATCGLCNGRNANMVITVHGHGKKFFHNE